MPTGGLISLNHKNHKKFKKILDSRRWCGITDRKDTDYDVREIGWNYYMNEFSAVIGLQQLKKLDKLNKKRRKIAERYYNEISLESKMPFDQNCSYHLYWILVKNRQKVRKELAQNGIETGTHYKPIHQMSFYKNSKIKLSNTENITKSILSIPCHPNLKEHEISFIIRNINKHAINS